MNLQEKYNKILSDSKIEKKQYVLERMFLEETADNYYRESFSFCSKFYMDLYKRINYLTSLINVLEIKHILEILIDNDFKYLKADAREEVQKYFSDTTEDMFNSAYIIAYGEDVIF